MSAESQNFGNQSQRLDAIRDRLAKATPGPWKARGLESSTVVLDGSNKVLAQLGDPLSGYVWHAADLIANAPVDLAYLLAELDKARAGLAQAWDEGFYAGYADGTDTGPTGPDNPYKEAP